MPKNKNKNQKAPFFFYMKLCQDNERKRGMNYSMEQMVSKCREKWNKMSVDERRPYENQSKMFKESRRDGKGILTSNGIAVEDEEEEEEAKFYQAEVKEKLIEAAVAELKEVEDVKERSFFIMSFNVMIRTDEGKYYPIELGLVEYAIKDGIRNQYHEFLDPGSIPLGYACRAKEHMLNTHKIPLSDFSQAVGKIDTKDIHTPEELKETRRNAFAEVVETIIAVLGRSRLKSLVQGKPSQRLVFCLEEQIDQVKGSLQTLAIESGYSDFADDIEVLNLTRLHFHICARNEIRPDGICDDDLKKSTFDYSVDTNCPFHEEQDNRYCALGVAKRLAYCMADVHTSLFDVKATSKHLPPRTDSEIKLEVFTPREEPRPIRNLRYHNRNRDSQFASEDVRYMVHDLEEPSMRFPRSNPNIDGPIVKQESRERAAPAFGTKPRNSGPASRSNSLGLGRGNPI